MTRPWFALATGITAVLASGLALLGCSDMSTADGPVVAPVQCRDADQGSIVASAPLVHIQSAVDAEGYFHLCTGVMLDAVTVLTAGHCIVGPTAWSVGTSNGQRAESVGSSTPFPSRDVANVLHYPDIGIIKLSPPGVQFPVYATLGGNAEYLDASFVVFRDKGGVERSPYSHSVQLFPGSSLTLGHVGAPYPYSYLSDHVATHGDSGAPVFLPGGFTVVGILAASGPCGNVITRIDQQLGWISANSKTD